MSKTSNINTAREVLNMINDILVSRIKILKKTRKGVKMSVTYIEMLSETKNLLLNVVQLVKTHTKLLNSFMSIETVSREEIPD